MASQKSHDFRAIYSNVQSFASSGNDIIVTLLRAEPQIADQGSRYRDGDPVFVEEAIVYLPVSQAKDMCEKILQMISVGEQADADQDDQAG